MSRLLAYYERGALIVWAGGGGHQTQQKTSPVDIHIHKQDTKELRSGPIIRIAITVGWSMSLQIQLSSLRMMTLQ